MPEKAERALKAAAQRKFPGDKERQQRYVYGARVMQQARERGAPTARPKRRGK